MSVDLKNFVEINITRAIQSSTSNTRPTVALLFSSSADLSNTEERTIKAIEDFPIATNTTDVFEHKDDAILKRYEELYFNNNGLNLHLVPVSNSSVIPNALANLPTDEILVMAMPFINTTNAEAITVDSLVPDEEAWSNAIGNSFTGINEKIFIAPIATIPDRTESGLSGYVEKYSGEEVVANYGAAGSVSNVTFIANGIEATVGAYYSNLNLNNPDSVRDYAFTEEKVAKGDIQDDVVEDAIEKHFNVDAKVAVSAKDANAARNIGGDDSIGNDLTNEFMRIVLTQNLTNDLVELIVTKIKYSQSGLTKVLACVNRCLDGFVQNGYIQPNAVYDEQDLWVDGELIIAKGTVMASGYIVYIKPFSSLTAAEKAAHQLPEIILVYKDQYSIRKVKVTGTVA